MKRFSPLQVCALLSLLGAPVAGAPSWRAVVAPNGTVRLDYRGKELGTLEPGLFEQEWRGAGMLPGKAGEAPAEGVRHGQIRAPGGTLVDVDVRAAAEAGGLRLAYRLAPQADVRLNSLHVGLGIPARALAGGSYTADGKRAPFPAELKDVRLYAGDTRALELASRDGARLRFEFAAATPVLVQDDRQWGPSFTVRIGAQDGSAAAWPAGKALAVEFLLVAEGGISVEYDGPTTIEAGREWLPLDLNLDIEAGSALDLSNLVPRHAPAGSQGRVIAGPGGHFAFAKSPGEPARFYGVNLCFSANYLSHEQSDRLAERLQRLGYNAVRVHHYESMLVDRAGGASTQLNPERLDQLDYLFAALKRRGIYVTTDLYVSRPVFAREVWEGAQGDIGMDDYKMAVPVNERAFANFKAFCVALLSHVNPYTGVRYAEDPALAWLSLINEGNPGNFLGRVSGPLKEDWARAWNRWLAARYPDRAALEKALGKRDAGQDPAAGTVPLPTRSDDSPQGLQLAIFLAENERDFYRRTRRFLREELGCQALLTDINSWTNPVQMQAARQEFDYVDDHFYVDHPEFLERPWQLPSRCPNTSPVAQGAPGGRGGAFVRLLDKPFTITEFNYSGPGRFRGVGGILTGALGAVQDWSGIWRFAYSHNRENLFAPSGAGYFDMATDPLSQAAERASLCLFLRGDMRPTAHTVAITMAPDDVLANPKSARPTVPGWNGLALVARTGTLVADAPKGADLALPLVWSKAAASGALVDPYAGDAGERILAEMRKRDWVRGENGTDPNAARFQSETGELTVDGPEDVLTLDTPRTAGGYAPAGKTIRTKAVAVEVQDTDATVWVSSLDNVPLAQSRRMLVTHLTDLQNSGIRYADKERRVLLEWGKLPHLVRAGKATVTLRMKDAARARVWALATSGKRLAQVPARAENGALVLPLDVDGGGKARILYEVEVGQ